MDDWDLRLPPFQVICVSTRRPENGSLNQARMNAHGENIVDSAPCRHWIPFPSSSLSAAVPTLSTDARTRPRSLLVRVSIRRLRLPPCFWKMKYLIRPHKEPQSRRLGLRSYTSSAHSCITKCTAHPLIKYNTWRLCWMGSQENSIHYFIYGGSSTWILIPTSSN